jgi:hypothetical protein
VLMDVSFGQLDNEIAPRADGRIDAVVFSTPAFNASSIRPATLRLRAGSKLIAVDGATRLTNVDKQGRDDMLVHFRAHDVACGVSRISLTARTKSGASISASDAVKTVGC